MPLVSICYILVLTTIEHAAVHNLLPQYAGLFQNLSINIEKEETLSALNIWTLYLSEQKERIY